jgi:hypothetical protein
MIPILAPPRSCSSLIAAMLGQHPSLYAPAELECFTGPTLGHCFEFAERVPAVTMHGLLRSVAQLQSGCQNDATVVAARQWLEARSHLGLIQSVSQAFLQWLRAWGEVGGIAPSQCSKAFLPQPISI